MQGNLDPNLVVQLIGHRVSEINTWIAIRCAGWIIVLVTVVIILYHANTLRKLLLAGFLCIALLFFEGSVAHYLHGSGNTATRLEKLLPNHESVGHEHLKALIKTKSVAAQIPPIGFYIPFLVLFTAVCFRLVEDYRLSNSSWWKWPGVQWTAVMVAGLIIALSYYAMTMRTAKLAERIANGTTTSTQR